jgi:hypothetical protein
MLAALTHVIHETGGERTAEYTGNLRERALVETAIGQDEARARRLDERMRRGGDVGGRAVSLAVAVWGFRESARPAPRRSSSWNGWREPAPPTRCERHSPSPIAMSSGGSRPASLWAAPPPPRTRERRGSPASGSWSKPISEDGCGSRYGV